jgi:GntR family transcriptional regulator, transcriptional repressor for pyruvate dehydrogenase complex
MKKENLSPIKKNNLTQQVLSEIKNYIIKNKLKNGDKLPSERELCEILEVSRSIVREALSSLSSIGIINKHQGKGIYVGLFDEEKFLDNMTFDVDERNKNINEILEIRKSFEKAVLSILIKKIENTQINNLRNSVDLIKNLKTYNDLTEWDINFHKEIFSLLKNPFTKRLGTIINEYFKISIEQDGLNRNIEDIKDDIMKKHYLIVEAIAEKDINKCNYAIDKHLE